MFGYEYMSRELDPNLFGTQPRNPSSNWETQVGSGSPGWGSWALEVTKLTQRVEKIRLELDEWLKTANLRIEKNLTKAAVLEQRFDQAMIEIREKMALLAGKLKERQIMEGKIESLLERHNQVIQSFESRLAQAIRTIDEQQSLIQKQQAQLDENRRTMERLKRL